MTHNDPIVGEGMEVEVPLDTVPPVVLKTAQEALPGVVLDEAEVKRKDGRIIFCLDGIQNGTSYELEILESGELLSVELDDSDDD